MVSLFRFLLVSLVFTSVSVISSNAQDQVQIEIGSSIDQKMSHILEVSRSNCERDEGKFEVGDRTRHFPDHKTITEIEVDLDSQTEKITIIDESGFVCSDHGASYYCELGGCRLHLVSNTDYLSIFVQGWEIIQNSYGDLLLLGKFHGSMCGEPSLTPCFNTIYFHGSKFVYKE